MADQRVYFSADPKHAIPVADLYEFFEKGLMPGCVIESIKKAEVAGGWPTFLRETGNGQTLGASYPTTAGSPKDVSLSLRHPAFVKVFISENGDLVMSTGSKHAEMFAHLLNFLNSRCAKGINPANDAAEALAYWADYYGAAELESEMRYQGALGELIVLERLINEMGGGAVSFWVGPDKSPQDFVLGVTENDALPNRIEVKTITNGEKYLNGDNAPELSINGIEQLRGPGVLRAVYVRPGQPDESGLVSVKTMVDAIDGGLEGSWKRTFRDKFNKIGLDEHSPHFKKTYKHLGCQDWDMSALRGVGLTEGVGEVSEVRYKLFPAGGGVVYE